MANQTTQSLKDLTAFTRPGKKTITKSDAQGGAKKILQARVVAGQNFKKEINDKISKKTNGKGMPEYSLTARDAMNSPVRPQARETGKTKNAVSPNVKTPQSEKAKKLGEEMMWGNKVDKNKVRNSLKKK